MDGKSSVVKSKSSNSAITTKSDRSKKSRSHPEFPQSLRSRGVYLEKKNAKGNLNPADNKGQVQQSSRPPPRPKRGQKKFLASVLTILSKNTAGTQYPDAPFIAEKENTTKSRRFKRLDVQTADESTQDALGKKKKYKSRILNEMIGQDSKKVVVLKNIRKRELTHSPSNYSQISYKEMSDAKYLSLPPLVSYDDDDYVDENDANAVENVVDKDKAAIKTQLKKDTILKFKDPVTLVSENSQKDEKGLYNFFVDLLETTFSVYNVNTEYNAARTPNESKVKFEIEESVANKLDVTKNNVEETPEPDACQTCCDTNKFYCFKENEMNRPKSPPLSSKPDTIKRKYKKTHKSESFFYTKQLKTESPKTLSVVMNYNKKSFQKRNRKQTFMNMLKEQLRMEYDVNTEPENMHQALQIIARNKRRNRRSIHFADDVTKTDNSDYGHPKPECVFKRRKVISSSTKSSKKSYNQNELGLLKSFRTDTISRQFSDITIYSQILPKSGYSTEDDLTESIHSLEVQGYNFEVTPKKRMKENVKKKIVFASPSSECLSESFTPNSSILRFSDSLSGSVQFCNENCTYGVPIKTYKL